MIKARESRNGEIFVVGDKMSYGKLVLYYRDLGVLLISIVPVLGSKKKDDLLDLFHTV